ncbi:hypothetical protein IE077_002626 [Cardiosporidium cionae]|uniref:Uncharacterized protein n=1 Tax=Cardiosporidium cionae TaxID=476202 RepID=A0ABQ7JAC9_9APIC|nr:hypothetical protein IE077_002626 [Cardiosporidium cionae]|eukprot:KAF8820947.1 hypothetical protein IE077_002626 [Cardiosporidium cionae]
MILCAGNCVECMANSDNVIRGGLTPKFKDTQLLLDILDFEPSGCTIERVIPEALDSSGILRWFHAPVERDYFQVYEIRASNPHGQVSHCFSSSCHSIGIVISTPAGVEICVNNEVHSPCQGDVLMFKPSSHFIMRRTHSEKSTASEQVVFLMYVATCGNNYSPTHGIS